MIRTRPLRASLALALCAAAPLGCAFRSPVLVTTRQSTANPKQLPLRVGVVFEGNRDYDPTSVKSIQYMFVIPTMWLYAQFPKPIEMEYVQDCVVDYLRDYSVFRYAYPYPFDAKDVDVVLRVRMRQIQYKNNTAYSTTMNIVEQLTSYIGLILMFALPQEKFDAQVDLEFALLKPPGDQPIASYQFAQAGKQSVYLVQQPYAEYSWYNSIFREKFMAVMEELKKAIEKDSEKIMTAAGPVRPFK